MDKRTRKSAKIKLNFDEVDFSNMVKPSSYLQYFQDLTALHYEELGIDHFSMIKKNKFWILSRISMVIDTPIFYRANEALRICTYMRKPSIAQVPRDYYVFNKGKLCVRAVSRWCVLELNSKKICRCGELFPFDENSGYTKKNALQPQLIKSDLSMLANAKIAKTQTLRVRHSDLDYNGHMNNARYADIAYNMCDFGQLQGRTIKAFDLHFAAELGPEEEFVLSRADYQAHSLFKAVKQNGLPAFFAKIVWG